MGLLVVGVVLFVGGLFALRVAIGFSRQEAKISGGVTVQGEVVRFNTRQVRHHSRLSTYTFPVLRFRTRDGEEREQESKYSWSGRPGQQVPVLYSPDDPKLCRVATSRLGTIGVVIVWVVTAAFIVTGAAMAINGLGEVL